MVIGNIIRNIFSESEADGSLLQQKIDRIVEDCIDDDDGNERSQGKHNITEDEADQTATMVMMMRDCD
jgi:hypothetical protein